MKRGWLWFVIALAVLTLAFASVAQSQDIHVKGKVVFTKLDDAPMQPWTGTEMVVTVSTVGELAIVTISDAKDNGTSYFTINERDDKWIMMQNSVGEQCGVARSQSPDGEDLLLVVMSKGNRRIGLVALITQGETGLRLIE